MSYDIVPKNLFSFPTIKLPMAWGEDDDWITTASSPSGISVSEDEGKVYVETALPGIDPKNVEITFQDGYLWVRGETKEEEKDKNRKYYRKAVRSFSYRVAVPGDIDINVDPEANYKHGMMKIEFHKLPKSSPKKIQVKMGTE